MTDHCFLIWGYNLTNVELLVVMQRGRNSHYRRQVVVHLLAVPSSQTVRANTALALKAPPPVSFSGQAHFALQNRGFEHLQKNRLEESSTSGWSCFQKNKKSPQKRLQYANQQKQWWWTYRFKSMYNVKLSCCNNCEKFKQGFFGTWCHRALYQLHSEF